jgi:DNA-directed RNA polymerase, mitochondrial
MEAHPLHQQQLDLEADMIASGATAYTLMEQKRATAGRASDVGAPAFMVSAVVGAAADGVREFFADMEAKRPQRRFEAYQYLAPVGADLAAAVAVKTLINWVCRPGKSQVSLTSVSYAIGEAMDNENMVVSYAKLYPDKVRAALDRLDKTTSHEGHRRRVMMALMRKDDFDPPRWIKPTRVLVGMKMIEVVTQATGITVVDTVRMGQKDVHVVRLTDEALKLLSDKRGYFSMTQPALGPCVVPPKQWDARGRDGGYHSPVTIKPLKLVRAPYRELVPGDVVEAVNHLQNTAWRVNKRVLGVMKLVVYDKMDHLDVLPPVDDVPIPPKPEDIAENEDARKAYRAEASRAYGENAARKSKRIMVYRSLGVAEQYVQYDAIYFPHSLDFRGRVYPISQWLHPQGPDSVKGLLEFAEAKPIGAGQGPGWLAIHGANCFGVDKVSLEERIEWVEEHRHLIKEVGADPMQCLWWTEADSPWCFLAFCMEWSGYVSACEAGRGEHFMSRLPVMVDGSCNGIQHFSAMLRDPVGGMATNLVPSDRPSDIYGKVAEAVIERLREDGSEVGAKWIEWGINRKVTKRSVMVLPYGGTFSSCRDYVDEAVRERGPSPWAGDVEGEREAINLLAKTVWVSIGDVVIGARAAMKWLQSCARLVFKHGAKSIWWRTPTGLKVAQNYHQFDKKQVKTSFLGNVRFRFNTQIESARPDASSHVNGFSPNFVHSLDASALIGTVNLAHDNGVTAFAAVHDSYGTHAADMQTLAACIRHAFVNLYEDHDVLADLHSDITTQVPEGVVVPPPPQKGALNIQEVLNSDFFFA